jgi:hypothetical protein
VIPFLVQTFIPFVSDAAGAVGGAVANAFTAAFEALVSLMTSLIASVLAALESLITATTTPDVSSAWFTDGPYGAAVTFGLVLLALCAMGAVVTAVRTGDPGLLGRRVALGVPAAVIAMALTPIVMQVLLGLADEVASSFNAVAGGQIQDFTGAIVTGAQGAGGDSAGGGAAGLLAVLLGPLMIFGALAIYAVLQLRAALVMLGVALVPLALAAEVWPALEGTRRRVMRLTIGLIAAKPVIFLALALGAAAMNATTAPAVTGPPGAPGSGVQSASVLPSVFTTTDTAEAQSLPEGAADVAALAGVMVSGLLVLGLAAGAPLLLFRLLPGGEAAADAVGAAGAKVSKGASAAGSGVSRIAGATAGAAGVAGRGASAAKSAAGSAASALGFGPGSRRGDVGGAPGPSSGPSSRGDGAAGSKPTSNGAAPDRVPGAATPERRAARAADRNRAGADGPGGRSAPPSSPPSGSPVPRSAHWRASQRRKPGGK